MIMFTIIEYVLRVWLPKEDWPLLHHETGFFANLRVCMNQTTGMVISWLALFLGTDLWEVWLHGTPLSSPEMAEVFNAFSLTVTAVLFICFLDKLADYVKHKMPKVTIKALDADISKQLSQKSEEETKVQHANAPLEKAVRKVIESFGILVGLCWEKACHAAMETMIESTPMLNEHRVISNAMAACILAGFIFPAWYYYVAPMAYKSVAEHEAVIQLKYLEALSEEEFKENLKNFNEKDRESFFRTVVDLKQKMKKYMHIIEFEYNLSNNVAE